MHRVSPPPQEELRDADLASAYQYPDQMQWRDGHWLRVNFVMSLDGSIVGSEGRSGSLGTDADRRVFRLARSLADTILVGAQTVRAENYRPATIPVAIVTRRLDLDPGLRMFTEREAHHARPLILTTDEACASAPDWLLAHADVIACGSRSVDLHRAITALTDRALVRILCEGGPALLDGLLAADLVDELLLTIVPLLVGSQAHLIEHPGGYLPPLRMSPDLVVEHEGTVLTRYRRT